MIPLQKEFEWPDKSPDQVSDTVNDISQFASLKIVSLLRAGSMEKRYSILKPADAKRFSLDYWRQNPGNDQERFVVACLNTKNVVQSVVSRISCQLDSTAAQQMLQTVPWPVSVPRNRLILW